MTANNKQGRQHVGQSQAQAIQEVLGGPRTTDQAQGDMMKVGFIIELKDGTQVYPSIVKEFASFAGLQTFVDVYIPHKYPHYKEVLILPMYVPQHIKDTHEAESKERCAAVNIGYETALEMIRRFPRAGMLHYVELLPGKMERSDVAPELYPYFTRGYLAALRQIGPGCRQAQ